MQTTVEYATYIIDITDAMLEHRSGLTSIHVEQVETINRRAVGFVTDYLQKEAEPLEEFRRWLSHDAMGPVTIIVGHAEMMLMGAGGTLQGPYLEAMQEIRGCGYALRDDVRELHGAIRQFLLSQQAAV